MQRLLFMKLEDILPLIDYSISEATSYLWPCFGNHCRLWSFVDCEGRDFGSCVVNECGQILLISFSFVDNSKYSAYYWLEPKYRQVYLDECKVRQIDPDKYTDGILAIELEESQDVFEKISAIYKLAPFDKSILLSIELSTKHFDALNELALKNGLTLEQQIHNIISV